MVRNHCRRVVGINIVPIQATFVSKRNYLIPTKNTKQKVEAGLVADEVKNRIENCPGGLPLPAIWAQGYDGRKTCYVCKQKALWCCTLCNQNYCLTIGTQKRAGGTKRKRECNYVPSYDENGNRVKDLEFGRLCFHQKHEQAHKNLFGDFGSKVQELFDSK